MKSSLILPLVLGGGFLVWKGSQAAIRAKELTWEIDSISGFNIAGGKFVFNLKISVFNTLSKTIKYKGIKLDSTVNGAVLTTILDNTTADLPAMQKSIITIPVSISVLGLLATTAGILYKAFTEGTPLVFNFNGFVSTNFGVVPFVKEYTVNLKKA